ncbi:uncharacterized protein LOC129600079 [Paramacrobiotus metropolitanus]|uniref:uncharacterized protein LOC129600079 n=1 Tax=Paramacrobiotus metropolitanus TaxID=2943436 RepID=UPI002445829D|nr:uncharacterized protein LOC129600079 [Paramacrobiotus metropolitanus]
MLDQNKVAAILKESETESYRGGYRNAAGPLYYGSDIYHSHSFPSTGEPNAQHTVARIKPGKRPPCAEELTITDLPYDIFTGIFSVLDERHKAIMRSVCASWNSATLEPDCRQVAIITFDWPEDRDSEFVGMMWLSHCITSAIKYALFVDTGVLGTVQLLEDLRIFQPIPATLVFSDSQLWIRRPCPWVETIVDKYMAVLNKMRSSLSKIMESPLSRVILKNFKLWHFLVPNCVSDIDEEDNRPFLDVTLTCFIVNVHTETDFIELLKLVAPLDFNIPAHKERLQRLLEWTGEASSKPIRQKEIMTILRKWQSADSRFRPDMEWKDVFEYLSSNLSTFPMITFRALLVLSKTLTPVRERRLGGQYDSDSDDYYDERITCADLDFYSDCCSD